MAGACMGPSSPERRNQRCVCVRNGIMYMYTCRGICFNKLAIVIIVSDRSKIC